MEDKDMEYEEVYMRLKQKYDEKIIDEIPKILQSINNNQRQYNVRIELDKLQDISNQLYYVYGVTDEIILLQAMINSLRHDYDIPDEKELIYNMPDGDFAQ
jgi:hypothetical protein